MRSGYRISDFVHSLPLAGVDLPCSEELEDGARSGGIIGGRNWFGSQVVGSVADFVLMLSSSCGACGLCQHQVGRTRPVTT